MKILFQTHFAATVADAALCAQLVVGKLWRDDAQTSALQRQLVSLRRSYLSARDPSLADALVELSFTLYKGSKDELQEANSLLEEASTILASRKDAQLRAARAKHLRGNVNERLGDVQLAIELHEQAELAYKRFNPLTWIRLANLAALATLYRRTKRLELAGHCDRLAEDLHHILQMSSPRMLPG